MGYIATKAFIDTKDDRYYYKGGQSFPRDGYNPTDSRIEELIKAGVISGHPPNKDLNKLKKADLIKQAEESDIDLTGKETKDDLIALLKE